MKSEQTVPKLGFVRRNGYWVIPVEEENYPRWIVALRLIGVPSADIVSITGTPIHQVRRTLAEYGSHDGRATYHLSAGSRETLRLPSYVPDQSLPPSPYRSDAYYVLTGDIGVAFPPMPEGYEPFFSWQRWPAPRPVQS